jgi:hypothetical protein
MKNNRILALLPTFGDTKDSKRIKILKESGFEVNVAYFERDQFSSRKPEADSFYKLGKISNGNYFKRINVFIKSIRKLRALVKKNDFVYSIGADLAIYSFFASSGLKSRLIIDVADIRPIQVSNSFLGKFLRTIESYVTKSASLIVVTSKGFIDFYYREKLGIKTHNFFLLENKVDYDLPLNFNCSVKKKNKIVLGYFGVLRDRWTLIFLNELVKSFPDKFEGVVAGINLLGEEEFKNLTTQTNGIFYIGPFNSPDDLPKIYEMIDVMLIFYPEFNSSVDWFNAKKICRSNRFYEASYFNKPLISFNFSDDGKDIDRLQIGLTLDSYDLKMAIEIIGQKLNLQNLEVWNQNLKDLPTSNFQFTTEKENLAKKIREII